MFPDFGVRALFPDFGGQSVVPGFRGAERYSRISGDTAFFPYFGGQCCSWISGCRALFPDFGGHSVVPGFRGSERYSWISGVRALFRISGGTALAIPEFPRADGFFLADGIAGWSRGRAVIPAGAGSKGSRPRQDPAGHDPGPRSSSPHSVCPQNPLFLGISPVFIVPSSTSSSASRRAPRNRLGSLPTPQTTRGKFFFFFGGGFQLCSASPSRSGNPFADPERGRAVPGSFPRCFPALREHHRGYSSFYFPFVPCSTSSFGQKRRRGRG